MSASVPVVVSRPNLLSRMTLVMASCWTRPSILFASVKNRPMSPLAIEPSAIPRAKRCLASSFWNSMPIVEVFSRGASRSPTSTTFTVAGSPFSGGFFRTSVPRPLLIVVGRSPRTDGGPGAPSNTSTIPCSLYGTGIARSMAVPGSYGSAVGSLSGAAGNLDAGASSTETVVGSNLLPLFSRSAWPCARLYQAAQSSLALAAALNPSISRVRLAPELALVRWVGTEPVRSSISASSPLTA